MILCAFKENDPYKITEFPFDDMYVTEKKFIKIGISPDGLWLGILVGDCKDVTGQKPFDNIGDFISIQTNLPVTKKEIISKMYPPDVESKILRDAQAGRNLELFKEYDYFIESIK